VGTSLAACAETTANNDERQLQRVRNISGIRYRCVCRNTRDATIAAFHVALKEHLDAMRAEGFDMPDVTELVFQETMNIDSLAHAG
jgi:hypothetical protein